LLLLVIFAVTVYSTTTRTRSKTRERYEKIDYFDFKEGEEFKEFRLNDKPYLMVPKSGLGK
jgi:hypothetical protein